ncbi:MAG: hypothetical protein WBB28_23485 [Crinalium sp.]
MSLTNTKIRKKAIAPRNDTNYAFLNLSLPRLTSDRTKIEKYCSALALA